jgi:RimJ/RimL family protein N-acetyltransferase
MSFGWEGELVRLVPLEKERHLDNFVRWINDPEVTEWLLKGDFPMSRLAEESWFDAAAKGGGEHIVFAIELLDGTHIGSSGIHFIDFRHGAAKTGSLIGAKEHWGKGCGTDAARVRARYCFDVLGLRLLTSGYLDGNERSVRMQQKTGYVECGRIPKRYWKRGAYRDLVMTFLDRERWRSLGA